MIAFLLSVAVVGNLVCGVVAARAAGFVGQSERARHEGGSTVTDWFTVVGAR